MPGEGTEESARFAGRVVVVTGAGSAVGRAVARRFGAEGAMVACIDADAGVSAECATEVVGSGGAARAFGCDVTDEAAVVAAVTEIASNLGAPAVVCNATAVGKFSHTTDLSRKEWDHTLEVNMTGAFLVAKATLPHLLATTGNIVNVASSAGVSGQAYAAAYCAAEAGVIMLSKSLALEYLERGVRVNAVAVGGVEAALIPKFDFPAGSSPHLFDRLRSPIGDASPEEVAALVAYVASDDARFMTGVVVSLDGGLTI